MKRICRNQLYPEWKLKDLIHARKGYDVQGVFHYMRAYSFNYFMMTEHLDAVRNVLRQVRNYTYDVHQFPKLTGKSVAQWDGLWHKAMKSYCSRHEVQHYPWTCPELQETEDYGHCQLIGQGYHKTLWHSERNSHGLAISAVRRRRTVVHMGVGTKLGQSQEQDSDGSDEDQEDDEDYSDEEDTDLGEAGGMTSMGAELKDVKEDVADEKPSNERLNIADTGNEELIEEYDSANALHAAGLHNSNDVTATDAENEDSNLGESADVGSEDLPLVGGTPATDEEDETEEDDAEEDNVNAKGMSEEHEAPHSRHELGIPFDLGPSGPWKK